LYSMPANNWPKPETDIIPGTKAIFIPQIIEEHDKWYNDCYQYIKDNYQSDTHYYLSYRLKTKPELARNKKFAQRLKAYRNINHVYSPFFFTLIPLLKHCQTAVLTSNASFIILDCLAANLPITRAYTKPRQNIWEPWRNRIFANMAEQYINNPQKLKNKLMSNVGQSSQKFFQVMEKYEKELTI